MTTASLSLPGDSGERLRGVAVTPPSLSAQGGSAQRGSGRHQPFRARKPQSWRSSRWRLRAGASARAGPGRRRAPGRHGRFEARRGLHACGGAPHACMRSRPSRGPPTRGQPGRAAAARRTPPAHTAPPPPSAPRRRQQPRRASVADARGPGGRRRSFRAVFRGPARRAAGPPGVRIGRRRRRRGGGGDAAAARRNGRGAGPGVRRPADAGHAQRRRRPPAGDPAGVDSSGPADGPLRVGAVDPSHACLTRNPGGRSPCHDRAFSAAATTGLELSLSLSLSLSLPLPLSYYISGAGLVGDVGAPAPRARTERVGAGRAVGWDSAGRRRHELPWFDHWSRFGHKSAGDVWSNLVLPAGRPASCRRAAQ